MMRFNLNAVLRQFKRARQYYVTVVLSLALTLTMLFSVFSILDVSYLKPLPYGESQSLYFIEGNLTYQGQTFVGTNTQNLLTLQQKKNIFSDLAIYFSWTEYKLYDEPTRPDVPVYMASHNFFDVLQVQPTLGRFFNKQEVLGNKQPSAVISYKVWQKYFSGAADVIGQSIQLNQRRFTIIGVTSDDWVLPEQANTSEAIWLPLDMDEQLEPRSFGGYSGAVKAIARLQQGMEQAEADAQLNLQMIAAAKVNTPQILETYPVSARLSVFEQAIRGDSAKIIIMLVLGVVLLTLIALINLGNLQLARAVGRIQPVAISYAFGATRRQLFSEVFVHNSVVASIAAVLALLMTSLSFGILSTAGAEVLPRLDALSVSGYMLGFVLIVVFCIASIFSWIELKTIDEKQLQQSLQSSGKGTAKQLKKGVSHSLVGLQLLFSVLTLAAGSQVLMSSLTEALRSSYIVTDNLWSVVVNYSAIPKKEERQNVQRTIAEHLKTKADILRVSRSSETRVPLALNVDGIYNEQGDSFSSGRIISVDEHNLALYGMTVQGRFFTRDDLELEFRPVIVNQRLANRLTGNPLGQKIMLADKIPHEIVGVVSNTDFPGNVSYEKDELYLPGIYEGSRSDVFLLQTTQNSEGIDKAELYAQLLAIDPRLDLLSISAVSKDFAGLNQNQRFAAWLAASISFVSLLMVCAGINGMVSYMVRMRRYDLGVKLAMGATQKLLLHSQLLDLAKPVTASALLAFSLAYFAIGYSRTVPEWRFALYWPELLLSIIVLLIFTAISCFIPVWQVLRADPIKALRNE